MHHGIINKSIPWLWTSEINFTRFFEFHSLRARGPWGNLTQTSWNSFPKFTRMELIISRGGTISHFWREPGCNRFSWLILMLGHEKSPSGCLEVKFNPPKRIFVILLVFYIRNSQKKWINRQEMLGYRYKLAEMCISSRPIGSHRKWYCLWIFNELIKHFFIRNTQNIE